jgi:hypothetical protein
MSRHPIPGGACSFWLRALAFVAILSSAAEATPLKPSQIFGDWEVTQLLVTDGVSNSQRSMNPDDARMVGRKYSFRPDSVIYLNEPERCTLDASLAKKTLSIKALFAGERLPKPNLVRDRFYRRAAQYALGPLLREQIAVYAYRCVDRETRLNQMGNWFAVTKDTIIWPEAPDAFVIMKRQPTAKTKEQTAFCSTATIASDKTICADRELWLMKKYTEAVHECAIAYDLQSPKGMRDDLDAYVAKRDACEGARSCVYSTLQEHVSILGQRVASAPDCLDLKQKK